MARAPARRRKPEIPRAWQRMLSGRRLDLLDPSPLDIEIEDIAHGLARVARWNGQTIGDHAFSVAQHSVVVEEIAVHMRPGLAARWRLGYARCGRRHPATWAGLGLPRAANAAVSGWP